MAIKTDSQQQHHDDPNISQYDNKIEKPFKMELVWRNIIVMTILHLLAFYGTLCVPYVKVQLIVFVWFLGLLCSVGVQAGAHRLWAHRSYKANFGLRLFLTFSFILALQNDLFEWVRDHRGHHKWSETDADPHNSLRGFFFSHMGWLLVKKHPDVIRKGKTVDLDDLKADPIVMFQRKYYIPLVLLIWGFIPTYIPYYFWGESLWYSFCCCVCVRYILTLHLTWLVNSWAHLYGAKPYDHKIGPVEASIRDLTLGEGFHNYHHAFPWDYSASELGAWDVFNPNTAMINFFNLMGWAWDLKKVSPKLIEQKMKSSGDGAQKYYVKGATVSEWSRGMLSLFSTLILYLAIHYVGKYLFNVK